MPRSTGDSSTKFAGWLQRQWQRITPWQLLLLPFTLIFATLSFLRRFLFQTGILRSEKLPVPVIVVGNLTVGGTGKTPLVLWLVEFLQSEGYRPGIISRGYGSSHAEPTAVMPNSHPASVGDEPVLLVQRARCPVWVGVNRAITGRMLLAHHPECDVIISDDGLQHYALKRDMEIVVVDGRRRYGNGLMLPAGPLREPMSRLGKVDAIVINGGAIAPGQYAMQLEGGVFRNLKDGRLAEPDQFKGARIHAIAGIGHPPRFFAHLRQLGLVIEEHAFPDHYAYQDSDLYFDNADFVLMTEKDAVKCAAFAPENSWALAVDAEVDNALGYKVLEKLRKHDGRKTA